MQRSFVKVLAKLPISDQFRGDLHCQMCLREWYRFVLDSLFNAMIWVSLYRSFSSYWKSLFMVTLKTTFVDAAPLTNSIKVLIQGLSNF